jgi:hypothetical protein
MGSASNLQVLNQGCITTPLIINETDINFKIWTLIYGYELKLYIQKSLTLTVGEYHHQDTVLPHKDEVTVLRFVSQQKYVVNNIINPVFYKMCYVLCMHFTTGTCIIINCLHCEK